MTLTTLILGMERDLVNLRMDLNTMYFMGIRKRGMWKLGGESARPSHLLFHFTMCSNFGLSLRLSNLHQRTGSIELTFSEECMAVSEPEPTTPLPCTITLVRKDGRSIIPTGLVYDHPPTQSHNVKQQYQ